jgi:TetR/AcrR family transcriptional regulator, transcriptional repressor for nem operon
VTIPVTKANVNVRLSLARPREFDETEALEAAMRCFWAQGYEATSVRDLAGQMGLTCASVYNAFGDKLSLYRRALDHYLQQSVRERVRRLESTLAPFAGITAFFEEIIERSISDKHRRGCMLVNSALEMAPHDPDLRKVVSQEFIFIEAFFRRCVIAGQRDGTVTKLHTADDLAKLLLGVLLGIRVLARTRPRRDLLEAVARTALLSLKGEPD